MCVCEGLRACKELYALRSDLIEFGIASNAINVSFFKNINFFIVEKHILEKLSATIKHARNNFNIKDTRVFFFGGNKVTICPYIRQTC